MAARPRTGAIPGGISVASSRKTAATPFASPARIAATYAS
jgi:hypothetical protein